MQTVTTHLPSTGFMRIEQILEFIPIGKSTWWARCKAGIYPAPVKLGPGTTVWRAEDIADLIKKLGSAEEAENE